MLLIFTMHASRRYSFGEQSRAGFLKPGSQADPDLPLEVRVPWFKPFMQSYLVVFIGYLTMYLIRKNFNIAQNDMISTYGLSMTQLGMIGLGFSITYGVGKTLVSYYDGKHQTIPAVHADPLLFVCWASVPVWAAARLACS